MLDAEPVEVAAIQGDELRDVKQQLAVIKSLYLPKPGKKAHQKIGIGGNHSLAFLANQETDQETDCGTVAQKYLRQTPCSATTATYGAPVQYLLHATEPGAPLARLAEPSINNQNSPRSFLRALVHTRGSVCV